MDIRIKRTDLMDCILSAYVECNIQAFPVDCFSIITHYGFRIFSYAELKKQNPRLHELASSYSRDSFTFEGIVAYNEKHSACRISFSLMHELGHFILGHTDDSLVNEDEADEFASHFLAPRILIHRYNCRNADQIHDTFGLSYAASNRALTSYREWYRNVSYRTPRQPSEPELQLGRIFFPEKKEIICQPDDDPEDSEFDMVDKYNYVLRVLKAGLDVPPEFKKDVQRYRRMGLI